MQKGFFDGSDSKEFACNAGDPGLIPWWGRSPEEDSGWSIEVLVTQLYLTLCDPMDCSLPDSSVQGILQARILEWVAISFQYFFWRIPWTEESGRLQAYSPEVTKSQTQLSS